MTVHAIVGDSPSGCTRSSPPTSSADYGERYIETAADIGGEFISICSDDWGIEMESLAHDSILKRAFDLSDTPIEETITVKIDGIDISEWTYNDIENAVYFEESSLPSPGSEIIIDYAVLADCE